MALNSGSTCAYLGFWVEIEKSLSCSLMDSPEGSCPSMAHFGLMVRPVGGVATVFGPATPCISGISEKNKNH